jgi:hypothetical protein
VLGLFLLIPGLLITIDGHDIVVVPHAKLLGVMISKDLKWIEHVDYICKKASKRLYASRLLKRSSTVPAGKLVRVYTTCVRSILEFSCEVWHYSLAQYLSDEIESIQRRALRIIFPDLKYEDALVTAGVVSLFLRRKTICEKLFVQMSVETSHKLHSLDPPRHKTGYFLRHDNCLSIPMHRTSIGLLIVLLWPVVRPTTIVLNNNCLATFLPRTIKINNL